MDYLKSYNSLVVRGKNRQLTGYTETHHIIPKCVGGTNDKYNLVKLTAREHFICHLLLCEIYPENRKMFTEVIPNISIDYPAEYGYGLVANKWFFKTFSGRIGLIGGKEKIDLIKKLMSHKEYQEYLGIEKFNDYISIPQKYACDNLISVEEDVANQLKESSSDIFLIGVGHVKSGLTHRLKKYKNSVFFDIGSGIDAIAGIIDINRPYFGNWVNYQIKNDEIYNKLDYLNYNGLGSHKFL
jgi:hypothetical protein